MDKLTYMLDMVFLKNTRRYTPIVCVNYPVSAGKQSDINFRAVIDKYFGG